MAEQPPLRIVRDPPPPHPSVDLTLDDPCVVEGASHRVCIAARNAGGRCTAPAITNERFCAAHARVLDASSGGKAKAAKVQAERDEAHALAVEARLGTRAIVARVFQDRHEDLRSVLNAMIDDAKDESLPAKERRAMRLALVPWIDQALGKPTQSVEVTMPTDAEAVEDMSLDELKALSIALKAEGA